jgi:hypothetical protein
MGGDVAQMGKRVTLIGYWWENRRERDHHEDQNIGGWIILRWRFHKILGGSHVVPQPVGSRILLSSKELVS